jgi:hypothetical protein
MPVFLAALCLVGKTDGRVKADYFSLVTIPLKNRDANEFSYPVGKSVTVYFDPRNVAAQASVVPKG